MASSTRRDLIPSSVSIATAGAIGTTVGTASAIDSDAKPDHVSITYDADRLERWQPRLSLSISASEDLTGVYGYVATSDEWDHDVLCYWARYAVQTGIVAVPWDAHQYDHEPIYLFIDSSASDPAPPEALETVAYSGYHHYKASFSPGAADLSGSRQSDADTHVSLDVVNSHHHYRRLDAGEGMFPDLRSWPDARPEWQAYGFYEDTSREAVDAPHTMIDRESWWAEGSSDRRFASLWLALGLDTDDRDDLAREA